MMEAQHKKEGRWIFVPVADITTPKAGRICYGPRWWKVTDDNCVLFFDGYTAPQCNVSKSVVDRIATGYNAPKTKAVFLEMAFVPHNCADYV